ncbi:cyclopropane-fatty-acyl-phospholipid synthase family protein [Bradyrhizobium sp.]|uniref:cyclopropane-fatty-acyl-phospholipid synthase family protein n=1 Tax=Bradyrhizobium sp. TaxID=376 RepID=UPI002D2CAC91|nr:cyclopropane-fatty-acyl-phospholipid synthase family protein [Bradyrhizobium sp.]HZR71808.1 cyclopropane-fatty-acyl-phospholipid synthase family protein [Bradyrhizobium sp.]
MPEASRARRLDSFRRLLAHINARILPDVGFVLWDGSTVPADLAADALAFVIADEGAIAAMIRRPNVDTFLNLWVASRFDLRNGSFFDLAARRPKTRSRDLMKSFDKRLALATLGRFLFIPRGRPWPLEAVRKARSGGSEAANKENVHYHYDVSNRFYELFLDPAMVYSCAYFRDWNNDLATAQADKLDMICRKLRLKSGETLLDIGCGWGALVCHAAEHYGVHAHGVTLAEEQLAYAREKVAQLGLGDRVTLELRDYSRLEGSFDKIASIGMFEHVGIANHPAYFETINRLLKPGGLYLHHAIALRSKSFERFRRRRRDAAAATAIGRYIFPGGELDHVGMSIANLERHNFEVHDVEGWREHYMHTTRNWHDRLSANREAAEREVGREKTRLWIAYLAVVSIAFAQGTVGIFQTLASKRVRGPSNLPPTRADLYS